jgi:hypothetical protein
MYRAYARGAALAVVGLCCAFDARATAQTQFNSITAFGVGSSIYSPFVNVTLEHDFFGSGRTITTTQVTTPLLPVLTPIEDRDRTYGKVAGGLAVNIAGNTDFMLVPSARSREAMATSSASMPGSESGSRAAAFAGRSASAPRFEPL